MDALKGIASARKVFAARVHDRMHAAGKSPADLAAATNIKPSRIARILSGEAQRLTLREMAGIAAALETPLSALFEG
jgi:transcriptional regulator with XRE-family HTH domain